MKKALLPVTYPLSLIYGFVTAVRNKLFDWGIMRELEFEVPLINIGNLAVGGTGKTPHIAYLIELLEDRKIGVLSRGYGRGTRGFKLAEKSAKPIEIGDEICMLKNRYPEIPMAVHENRALGITELLANHPEIELILLDDAFQHRHVKPHFNILLTEYDRPFFRDLVMPAGRLREWRSGYKRADAIVYTKCPSPNPTTSFRAKNDQPQFFSHIEYAELMLVHGEHNKPLNPVLVSAIARPNYLESHIRRSYASIEHRSFRDHYSFKQKDIDLFFQNCDSIICTEKDWIKIKELNLPENKSVWVQSIEVVFSSNDFDERIKSMVDLD